MVAVWYRYILSILILILPTSIFAQADVSFGIRGGANIMWANYVDQTPPVFDLQLTPAWHESFGVRLNFDLNQYVALRTGFNIQHKGFHIHGNLGAANLSMSPSYHNIELPLIFGVRAQILERLYLRQLFGISGIVMEGGPVEVKPKQWPDQNILFYRSTDNHPFTAQLTVGIDMEYQLKKDWLLLFGAAYHRGLREVRKGEIVIRDMDGESTYPIMMEQNQFLLSLGILIPAKKELSISNE